MQERDEPYKVELINDLPEDAVISFYTQGEFTDLCAGPHLDHTGRIKGNGFKLHRCLPALTGGATATGKMLQRIYGIAFPEQGGAGRLTCQRIEEAKKRDHRKLGKELGLFMLTEEGPGFPFFLPKGMVLRNTLMDYWREMPQALRLCGDLHPHYPQPGSCGSSPATGITTRTICTPPSLTARITPSSP